MDSVFLLNEEARHHFLHGVVQAIGCTYICLWSYYVHPINCLFSMDGWYNEESSQPTSSSGSLAQKLFNEYRLSLCSVENDFVPGLAFKENFPYLELSEFELLGRASTESQRQFYQEARIKTAAFMGCRRGEIEIGLSTLSQINMEMEMRNWFPEHFSQQSDQFRELPHLPDQNRPSSSSSSLMSLSMGSPECSSLYFNITSTPYMPESLEEAPIEQAIEPTLATILSQRQAMQVNNLFRSIQFPTAESDDAAMTRAMLAVLSSPSSSSSSYNPLQNQAYNNPVRREMGAFKTYIPALAPKVRMNSNPYRENILKRAITFFGNLNNRRIEEQSQGGPTGSQLQHMISERKRREKLNESFEALRSLLPPGTKKDKASVLSGTRDSMSALKAQIFELEQKNRLLEARFLPSLEAEANGSSTARFNIRVTQALESSDEQEIGLGVTVRGDCDLIDLVIRLLEFLKRVNVISVVLLEADTKLQQKNSFSQIVLRFKIKASEWDDSAFREAITRVVADVTQ